MARRLARYRTSEIRRAQFPDVQPAAEKMSTFDIFGSIFTDHSPVASSAASS